MIYMRNMVQATIWGIVWGLGTGIQQVGFNFILPYYYGKDCIATVSSIYTTAMVFGSAIGPILYGVAIDNVHSWSKVLWATVPFGIICAILLIIAKKPIKTEEPSSDSFRKVVENELN